MSDTGWGVFSFGYIASAVTGLLIDGSYFIPVVGPYVAIPDSQSGEGVILGLTLGTIQVVALPIAIVGTVRKRRLGKRFEAHTAPKAARRHDLKWTGMGLKLRF